MTKPEHKEQPSERTFLDRILEAMDDAGMKSTQVAAGELVGVKQSSVHEWKQPDRAPYLKNTIRAAKALDVCVEWLLTERGPKRPSDAYNSNDPQVRRLLQCFGRLNEENRESVLAHAEFILSRQRRGGIKPV